MRCFHPLRNRRVGFKPHPRLVADRQMHTLRGNFIDSTTTRQNIQLEEVTVTAKFIMFR